MLPDVLRRFFIVFTIICAGSAVPSIAAEYDDALNLYYNGQYTLAESALNDLILKDPENTDYRAALSDVYISQNRFSDAVDVCAAILEREPKNYSIRLKISRLYSWMGKYGDSVDSYDHAISLNSNDMTPRIEKTRVLVWWGKTDLALNEYSEISREFPEKWVSLEAAGKKNLWYGRIEEAVRCFEQSLAIKPDNEEVLFDIAQIYSNGGDHERADEYYETLLTYNPYHTAAAGARERNGLNIDGLGINGGYNLWDAESFERNTEVAVGSSFFTLSKRLNALTATATLSRERYRFSSGGDLSQNSAAVSLGYQHTYRYGFGAGFTQRYLTTIEHSRESFYTYGWYRLWDRVVLNATLSRNNMIQNRRNIMNDLNDTGILLNPEFQANDRLILGGRIRGGLLSDENSYVTGALYVRYTIVKSPKNLYTIIEGENSRYEEESGDYFAPPDYSILSAQVGFLHDIGIRGFYYGANRLYYEIKSKTIWDSNHEFAFQPSVTCFADINHHIQVDVSWSMTESTYYDDITFSGRIRYLF